MFVRVFVLIFVIGSAFTVSSALKTPRLSTDDIFHRQILSVLEELQNFQEAVHNKKVIPELKNRFVRSRLAYKRSSILVDYFFPILRKSINGPDLKYAEEDNPDGIVEPHGFQVIERILYGKVDASFYQSLSSETKLLEDLFRSIKVQPELDYKFRNELVFDAMRLAAIRLVSLGITGFDSPISMNSLDETKAVLQGMNEIAIQFGDKSLLNAIEAAGLNISSAKNFDSFDRLGFIKTYADPLYGSIVQSCIAHGFLLPDEKRPLNQKSNSIFAHDFFDINFFSPNIRFRMTPERVSLGKALFSDPILSISNTRSCVSCHKPGLAFTDGRATPIGTSDSILLRRNTPTLPGAVFQTRFFYDSRTSTLENQLNSVVHNADEMNGSLKEGIKRIKKHDVYFNLFQKAYPNDAQPVTEYNIANAISSYIRSLPTNNSKFDKYMRDSATLSQKERDGFNLFAGKAKCATCHYIPLFNGLVPPEFTETESEVIGVPKKNFDGTVVPDDDLGKFLFTGSDINKHAFKTPTLRNIAITAPYMHNGVFKTLEEVMDFYNKGGGSGLGIAPENQTLPPDRLGLSKKEIKKVIAFLKTLSDIQPNSN